MTMSKPTPFGDKLLEIGGGYFHTWDFSGSGRVDMPTRPVAAARAAVATGASG